MGAVVGNTWPMRSSTEIKASPPSPSLPLHLHLAVSSNPKNCMSALGKQLLVAIAVKEPVFASSSTDRQKKKLQV